MFNYDLPEFPFEIDWDSTTPMYCINYLQYTRTPVYKPTEQDINGEGFSFLDRDEIGIISRDAATGRLELGTTVSVEFIYLLGRGI